MEAQGNSVKMSGERETMMDQAEVDVDAKLDELVKKLDNDFHGWELTQWRKIQCFSKCIASPFQCNCFGRTFC